ncbi:MAG: alpha/beta fold hydrolase, partial [Limnobacter sp.]|nr:alpha/beta fold hydrolase [Limnobacter sp.]
MSVVFSKEEHPEGTNIPGCSPAPGRSHVVLVHGTFSSTVLSFSAMAPRLANSGYCVHALNYGAREEDDWFKATGPIEQSAESVGQFIDEVLLKTGADRVDLIGHSQGGLLGFYLIKHKGYDNKIRHFLAMAPSVAGTTLAGDPDNAEERYCVACVEQNPESPIIKKLQDGPLTLPSVKYTVLATK